MRSVLLVAPHNSYRIHAYVEAANHLGINLVIASQSQYSLVSAVSDGIQVDFSDDELSLVVALEANKQHQFQAVISTDDGGVRLASVIAQALGLSSNAPDSAELTRRKDLARQRLQSKNIVTPAFRVVDVTQSIPSQIIDLAYPVVVKPLSMSGSKGVIRVNNDQELLDAVDRVKTIVAHISTPFEREHVLLEEYISGNEVAFEGLLHKGKLRQLTIFDKPDPMEGPYFEETYYVTPTRLPEMEQLLVHHRVEEACEAYGLREGPIHAELRLRDNEVYIIEIASRTIGGDCADMLKFGLNIGLEELVLLQSLGKPLDIPTMENSVGVLMIPIPSQGILRRVEGISQAKKVPHITEIGISVRDGYDLFPLPEGSSYLGFIFAKAPTADLVEEALRTAHTCLKIVIMPTIKVFSR
ncbi:MAG: phosphoribosylglycinamide synthetase [Piscirickettsiaceae bacterium]|nr:MAG: phosphoribosylglycinamide synthetase [Piscirickettsiaceae bacterium]